MPVDTTFVRPTMSLALTLEALLPLEVPVYRRQVP
jgi:hypothetical protein